MKIDAFTHPKFSWDIGIYRVWKNYWYIHILCFTVAIFFGRKNDNTKTTKKTKNQIS